MYDLIESPSTEDAVDGLLIEIPGAGILRQISDRPRGPDLALGRQRLAREHPREGRLASSVSTNETDPIPGRDLESDRADELTSCDNELEVVCGQHKNRFVA